MTDETNIKKRRGRPPKYSEHVKPVGMRLPDSATALMDAECLKLGKPGPDETIVPLSRTEFMVRAINCYCKKLANVRRHRKHGRVPADVN